MVHPARHILIAEDCQETLDVYAELVECLGLQAIRATSGQEGYQLFKDRKDEIALVITDGRLPQGDGLWLAKRIQEDRAEMPVILISGVARDFLPETSAFTKIVTKPVDFEQFKKILEDYAPRSFLRK